MKLIFFILFLSLFYISNQTTTKLKKTTNFNALQRTNTKDIVQNLRVFLTEDDIKVLRYDAKIPADRLPATPSTLSVVLNTVKGDDKLKKTINLAYDAFCTLASQPEGFRWVNVKAAATQSSNPDIYMIPFLRFREISNVLTLALAAETTYFTHNFMATNCPSKSDLPTREVETVVSVKQLLSQNPSIQTLCQRHAKDFFLATQGLTTNANLRIEMVNEYVKIYDGTTLLVAAMAAGSVTTFSDIDQTISSPNVQNVKDFLYYQCLQAEIVRAFDAYFALLFENSSFDTFDLNAYVNGFFEMEVKHKDFTSINCATRIQATDYIQLNTMVSLFTLNNLLHHIQGKPEENVFQAELKSIVDYNKNKEDPTNYNYMFYDSINLEHSEYMKSSIQRVLIVQPDPAAAIYPLLANKFAQKSDEQKVIYLRNIAYYIYIKEANREIQNLVVAHPQNAGVSLENYIGNLAYNSKEYIKKVLKSVFYTNEAVFTGGSLMHVLGGQLKKKEAFRDYVWSFREFDVVQSFYLNIGFAMDHFIHYFYHYMEEVNQDRKKYYLWEGMLKLAKYSNRAFEALDFQYSTQCPNAIPAKLSDAPHFNISPLIHFKIFIKDVLDLKDNKKDEQGNRKTLQECINSLFTRYQTYCQTILNLRNDNNKKDILFMAATFQSILEFIKLYNFGGMAKQA